MFFSASKPRRSHVPQTQIHHLASIRLLICKLLFLSASYSVTGKTMPVQSTKSSKRKYINPPCDYICLSNNNKVRLGNASLSALTPKQHYFCLLFNRLKGPGVLKMSAENTGTVLFWVNQTCHACNKGENVIVWIKSWEQKLKMRGGKRENVSQLREKENTPPFLSSIGICQNAPLFICIRLNLF